MMNSALLPALVAVLSAVPVSKPDAGESEVRLEVRYPEANATLSEGISVSFILTGPATAEYEIELRCAETTHYLLADQNSPGRSTNDPGMAMWNLWDPWFLPQAGPLELEVRVFELDGGGIGGEQELVLKETVPFEYAPLVGDELQREIEGNSSWIANCWMRYADQLMPQGHLYYDRSPPTLEGRRGAALSYVEARRDWLIHRVDAYTMLARDFENALLPGDALRAMNHAKELYDAESGEIVLRAPLGPMTIRWRQTHWTHSPSHLGRLADFYAKRKDTKRAQYYLEQAIAYYRDQVAQNKNLDAWHLGKCSEYAAWETANIAKLQYLFSRDREGYDRWTAKYRATKPKETGGGGLLDQR